MGVPLTLICLALGHRIATDRQSVLFQSRVRSRHGRTHRHGFPHHRNRLAGSLAVPSVVRM